ncbi:MAG: type I methionyl aminopeptidase [Candidatus Taylorbacteria bacterium]|nr:type I methionyl aminopeptidase [Candidatus Taylorbacteria bacterium]
MTITLKTPEEIALLREGGRRLAAILKELETAVRPGRTAAELNALAEKLVNEGGDASAFLNYQPTGAKRPYPAALCVSVNDEVVHGIPHEGEKILKQGDIVSLDLGLVHKNLFTDMAVTVPVGEVDAPAKKLLTVTEEALRRGIAAARGGNRVGDISYAIESYIKSAAPDFGIVEELAGHGVGYKVHEDPYVPNYGQKGTGEILKPGMVLAIEPMVNEGTKKVLLAPDDYTYRTADGKRSAHFEKTIVITDDAAEVLTDV